MQGRWVDYTQSSMALICKCIVCWLICLSKVAWGIGNTRHVVGAPCSHEDEGGWVWADNESWCPLARDCTIIKIWFSFLRRSQVQNR